MYAMILACSLLAFNDAPEAKCCDCDCKYCCCNPCDCRPCVACNAGCNAGCKCIYASFVSQAVEPKKADVPKPAELKVPANGSFVKTKRGGILLHEDGSIEVIFEYGRDVQQRDIDEWYAQKGSPTQPYYTIDGNNMFGVSGGCATGSCGSSGSRPGLFRRR